MPDTLDLHSEWMRSTTMKLSTENQNSGERYIWNGIFDPKP